MDFRIDQTIAAALDDVEEALLDPEFIAATANLPQLGSPEVLERTVDDARADLRVRYHFIGQLSSAVTRVVDPNKLSWVDETTVDLAAHTSHHAIKPDNYADRLEAAYDVRLEAKGDATRRLATGTLKVHVPLVGGRVEKAIVGGITEHADAEAELLGTWIAAKDR
jgi:hypothetical protein